jgi:hypothetical protein
MSPITHMQVDFESWSKLKLRLKVENFIKEYVSLILLLSTIFTAVVGRILTNSLMCILLCSSHRDLNNLAQIVFFDYLLYDVFRDSEHPCHSIRKL